MARNRVAGVTLPEGVEKTVVRKKCGKVYTYYYWNPGRGTAREGERIKLPSADTQPDAFWREVKRRREAMPAELPPGSVGALIARYRDSDEFKRLSEGTQSNYDVHMRRFESAETWGLVAVGELVPLVVQTARDAMKETPVMANQIATALGLHRWPASMSPSSNAGAVISSSFTASLITRLGPLRTSFACVVGGLGLCLMAVPNPASGIARNPYHRAATGR